MPCQTDGQAVRPLEQNPAIIAPAMAADLTDARAGIAGARRRRAAALIEQSIAAAAGRRLRATSSSRPTSTPARAAAAASTGGAAGRDRARWPAWRSRSRTCSTSRASRPRAGSTVLADAPPAAPTAPPWPACAPPARRSIGRTNMTEFAFSGVGINPHHGTPANPATAALDPTPRIPGGSTSGGAVSVATGAAWAAWAPTPAARSASRRRCNGIVGFKSTARLVPTDGALPLSTTLDTVCAMTRSVRDAVAAARGAGRRAASRRSAAPLSALSPRGADAR